ncbi:MAG: T9SS type A sorting domain-containing protein [Candidatus Diapherotrites archaeon]|nr:T9SS type A sorting domain-containing protein [Candidatus Diapherotrites archaeon]
MDVEEIKERVTDFVDEVKDAWANHEWTNPKLLGSIAALVLLVGGIALLVLAPGGGAAPAKVQITVNGKPLPGAYVTVELSNGKFEKLGPADSEGYVNVPGGATIVAIQTPDGKTLRKTAFVSPGMVERLSFEPPFQKSVTFYAVGLDGEEAKIKIYVDGNLSTVVQTENGFATVNFGKDVTATPNSQIEIVATAPGYQSWDINTTGRDLQGTYSITFVPKATSVKNVQTGTVKMTITEDGNAFNGRVDVYDSTGTLVESAPVTDGGAEVKGLPTGTYIVKVYDENGAYISQKKIVVDKPDVQEKIEILSTQEAVKRGVLKKVTTSDGRTIYVPTAYGGEENASGAGPAEEVNGSIVSVALPKNINPKNGAGAEVESNGVTYMVAQTGPTIPVHVYVVDKSRMPVIGATVDVNYGYRIDGQTTDSAGSVVIGLHSGECAHLKVLARGYRDANADVCAGDGQKTITLEKAFVTGDIDVLVKDYMGNPVADAKIVLKDGSTPLGKPAYSGNDGKAYIHDVQVGKYYIVAEKDGMVGTAPVDVNENQTTNVVITLYPGTATLKIGVKRGGILVPAKIKVVRLDTGSTVATANTVGGKYASITVPAIIPIAYSIEADGVHVQGSTLRLAPGDSKEITVSIPDFKIPDTNIVGIYDLDGHPLGNLPVGKKFKIVAIVGSASGGSVSVTTDDMDDISIISVEPSTVTANGYTTVTILGAVTAFPTHTHAKITISAPDSQKSVTLPIGAMMRCTGQFCYSVVMKADGKPLADDFKINADQNVEISTQLLYRGSEPAGAYVRMLLKMPDGATKYITPEHMSWTPGDVVSGKITVDAKPGIYTIYLEQMTANSTQKTEVKRFVVAPRKQMYIQTEPSLLIRTDVSQKLQIGVKKSEGSMAYFAPPGLTYTIYGVDYYGNGKIIQQIRGADSPATVTMDGLGKYEKLIIDAWAPGYTGSVTIPLKRDVTEINPQSINLSGTQSTTIHITNTSPDYPVTVSVSTSKNSACNLEFHAEPTIAVLDPINGQKTADINVWYTGGSNCASTVGGDVIIKVMNSSGETLTTRDIHILATPRGSCIRIRMPEKVSGRSGSITATVENSCTKPVTVELSTQTKAYQGSVSASIYDPLIGNVGNEQVSIDPNETVSVRIKYTLQNKTLEPVTSGAVTLVAKRATDNFTEVEQNSTTVYTTDVSNCLHVDFADTSGKLEFTYTDGRYAAIKTVQIDVGAYCRLNTIQLTLNGDLSKSANIDQVSWQQQRIDLMNALANRDVTKPFSQNITITITAKNVAPLYKYILGELNFGATVAPTAGPDAGKTMGTSSTIEVYTVPVHKLGVTLNGTGHFDAEQNMVRVHGASVSVSIGGKPYMAASPVKSITIQRACAAEEGAKSCDGQILLHGADSARVSAGYADINVGYDPATDLQQILKTKYIVVEGKATLNDGNTLSLTGYISIKYNGTTKVTNEGDGCIQIVSIPDYATEVNVVAGDHAAIVNNGKTAKSATVKPGATVCIAANLTGGCDKVPESPPGSEYGSEKYLVTYAILPLAYGTAVEEEKTESIKTPKTITTKSVALSPEVNPFDGSAWAGQLESAWTSPSVICLLQNGAIYPSTLAKNIQKGMHTNQGRWPEDVNIPVYYNGLSAAGSVGKDYNYGYCTITASGIACKNMSNVAGKYASAWAALGKYVKDNKITVSELAKTIKKGATTFVAGYEWVAPTDTVPVLWNSYGTTYFEPKWYLFRLKVPKNVKCTAKNNNVIISNANVLNQNYKSADIDIPGISQGGTCEVMGKTLIIAAPAVVNAINIGDLISCYWENMPGKINALPSEISDETIEQFETEIPGSDVVQKYEYNGQIHAILAKINASMVPLLDTTQYFSKGVCFRFGPDKTAEKENIYLVINLDAGNVNAYIGVAPNGMVCKDVNSSTEQEFITTITRIPATKHIHLTYNTSGTHYVYLNRNEIVIAKPDSCYNKSVNICGKKEAIATAPPMSQCAQAVYSTCYAPKEQTTGEYCKETLGGKPQYIVVGIYADKNIVTTGKDWSCGWDTYIIPVNKVTG